MNGVDYIILSVAFVSLFVGYKRGFIREFFPLLNLIVAILVAFFSFDVVARFLNFLWMPDQPAFSLWGMSFGVDGITRAAAFVLTFVVMIILGSMLTSFVSERVQAGAASSVDRILGFLFGGLRAAVVIVLLVMFGGLIGASSHDWWLQSVFVPKIAAAIKHNAEMLPSDSYQKFLSPPSLPEKEEIKENIKMDV